MSDTKNAPTKLLPCSCYHEFQDARYGRGIRVHNYGRTAFGKNPGYRCTVCKKEKPV